MPSRILISMIHRSIPNEPPVVYICRIQCRPYPHCCPAQAESARKGLDPNKWFGNVELLVSQSVGEVTVQYVSNIYKYYVAYKLVLAARRNPVGDE